MSENASDPRHGAAATDAEVAAIDTLVTMVVESRKARAAFEAMEVQALAALAAVADQQRERLPQRRGVRELPLREIAAEVALAVRGSDRVMQGMIVDAAQTVTLFPAAVTALAEGRISRGHVSALVDAGARIDDDHARARFEAEAVGGAERESVGRFRSIVGAMGERINPRPLADRHRLAREDRAVRIRDRADGMAELWAVQPAVIAYGIHDRLTQQAKAVQNHARAEAGAKVAGAAASASVADRTADREPADAPVFAPDERTLDQIRADLFADQLLTGAPTADPTATGDGSGVLGAIRALVQITVPVLTAAGIDDDVAVAELNGAIPVDPDTARDLVGAATGWDRVLTHPITGAVLAVDRYTPNADLKRWKTATDIRCRGPGCRMPAHRCDLDHNHAAAEGGATEACNLCHFCRRHHVLKHRPGWKVRQLSGGRIEWTTPTGRVYIDHPPPRAAYLSDPPPRPGANEIPVVDRGRTTTGTARDLVRRYRDPAAPGTGGARGTNDSERPERSRTVTFVADGDAPF